MKKVNLNSREFDDSYIPKNKYGKRKVKKMKRDYNTSRK